MVVVELGHVRIVANVRSCASPIYSDRHVHRN
jgi:hypothetical protein